MDRSKVAIAFMYCDYSDAIARSEVGILSSIIRQLVEQCAHVPPEIRAFRDRYASRVTRPTVEERIRMLAQFFSRTYILIDALVGCPSPCFHGFACQLTANDRINVTKRVESTFFAV